MDINQWYGSVQKRGMDSLWQSAKILIWGPKIWIPKNGWFIMHNSINMDDLVAPPFWETSIWTCWSSFEAGCTNNHLPIVDYGSTNQCCESNLRCTFGPHLLNPRFCNVSLIYDRSLFLCGYLNTHTYMLGTRLGTTLEAGSRALCDHWQHHQPKPQETAEISDR